MGGIPIVGVVGRELEVPFELAGVAIERHERTGVEVVAAARIGIPVGTGIADAPVDQVGFGIVGAGDPGGAAAGLPGVAGPGFVAGFAGSGNGVEAPRAAAGLRVVGIDEAADAGFAAADTDQDFAANGERRQRHAVAGLVIFDLGRPAFEAALGVERDQVAIERGDEDLVIENGGPAVHAAESDVLIVLRNGPLPGPQARGRCEGRARRRCWGR